MKLPVYLDNHATTPADPRVLEAMLPYFTEKYGNAASNAHPFGWEAKEAVEVARSHIATLAGSEPGEVIFTSGATESINTVLKGFYRNKPANQVHIVTAETEHSAVLDTCTYLESLGVRVTRLPANADGTIAMELIEAALQSKADLLSLMHANNEIGTILPLTEISGLCKKHGTLFHVDAAQSYGKLPIQFRDWEIDFLSISGHKIYAPKGVGCLLIRRQNPPLRITPLLHGGGHEGGFRSGTLNVPAIVGLGTASVIAFNEMAEEGKRIQNLRDELLRLLETGIPDLQVNGTMKLRLDGNLNISIPGIEGQYLLPALRSHISVSSGSACTSAHPRPSHVLASIGQSDELAQSSIRFGIGRFNNRDEIHYAAEILIETIVRLRNNKSAH